MTKYVSNLDIGQLVYMPDGTNWTAAVQNTNLGSHSWTALAYDGTKFVALGSSDQYISTSTDGTNWTTAVQNTNLGFDSWYALVYDGTKFIALGYYGHISTSTDGTNWTAAVQNTNLGSYSWSALTYDGTKFVALGQTGYISNSTDGTNWTTAVQNTNLGSNDWTALAYNGTKFVALSRKGRISTSTNGTNWTAAVQNTNLGANNWCALAYDGTKFVALGDYGHISTSTDGTNWTTAVQNLGTISNNYWYDLAYDGTKFVALGTRGYISTSPNPTTTKIPIGGNNFDGQPIIFTKDIYGLISGTNQHNLLFNDTTIAKNVAQVYSVAEYIPDDGYDYELLLSVWSIPTKTSGSYSNLLITPGTNSSDPGWGITVGRRIARTKSSNYNDFKTVWIPISANDKVISFYNRGGSTTTYNCMLHGYRRIGKND